ncbi:hypothetical protein [Succinimonas sp.]|uniref:hypothetical protein n=1 Tax=Succinimonas sp. TaxID=1936151 RepID=UPI00386E16C3
MDERRIKKTIVVLLIISFMVGMAVLANVLNKHELSYMAKETLKDALAGTRYADLDIISVSGFDCHTISSGRYQSQSSCTATAEFSDGTRSRICMESTERFRYERRPHSNSEDRVRTSINVTVSLCGIDAGIESTRSFR